MLGGGVVWGAMPARRLHVLKTDKDIVLAGAIYAFFTL